jgi:hypothetical protein
MSCFHSFPLGNLLAEGFTRYANKSINEPATKNLTFASIKGCATATPNLVAAEADAHKAANNNPGTS